jgi:hypothetical protein
VANEKIFYCAYALNFESKEATISVEPTLIKFQIKLLSDSEKLAVLFVKFSFYYYLSNVDFRKFFSWCFYYFCNLKLQFGPIFKILTFDFGVKFAKFPRKTIFFKSPISQDSLIGKFQHWAEMKVKKFHSSWPFWKYFEKPCHFFFWQLQKNHRWSEKFCNHQKWTHISTRLLCKKFKEIGLSHASQLKLKPNRQFLWIRQ